ncbi:MAG: hypothetical protein J6334_02765, partial [Kiritimatiellae bacterium]|nr:hypothetical protein [Kiritimatiellia bacterium]
MKRLITTLFAITLFLPGIVSARKLKPEVERAMANGAMAKIHLKVLDEKGIIVTNASVRVAMDMPKGEYAIYGRTDTNGLCVVQGKTNGNYIDFLVGKDGYYGSHKRVSFVPMGEEHDVKENKWQPYGDKLEIVLNKVRNPIVLLKDPERKFIL